MLTFQMSQSEEGMARIEAMCVLVFQFFYNFYNHGQFIAVLYSMNMLEVTTDN